MQKVAIVRISKKHRAELSLRRKLKAGLVMEHGDHCMPCGDKYRDWRGLSLSHVIPLSRGGKTTRDNCLLECYPCHEKYEKHPELREYPQTICCIEGLPQHDQPSRLSFLDLGGKGK